MTTGEHQLSLLQMISAVLRRPLVGPLLFGLVFAGAPSAVMFGTLGDEVMTARVAYCMLVLTPIAVVVATIGAVWSTNRGWRNLLLRSFVVSASACIPIPTILWDVAAWRQGYDVFTLKDLLITLYALSIWAIVVTLISWPLALAYVRIQNWRTQAGRRRPS